MQTLNPLDLDQRALAAASIAGVVATLAAGLLPAWLGTRVDAGDSLRVVNRGGTETRGARMLARGLLAFAQGRYGELFALIGSKSAVEEAEEEIAATQHGLEQEKPR